LKRFCANCGREETPDNPLIDGLCVQCFISHRKLAQLPSQVEVVRCSVCGAVKSFGGRFSPIGLDEYVESLVEKYVARRGATEDVVQVVVEGVEIREGTALVKLRGWYGGASFEQVIPIRLNVKEVVCPLCLKYKTRSYNVIIQLRPGNSKAESSVRTLAKRLQEHPGVVDVKESKDGVDLYVTDKHAATQIVKEVGAKYISRVLTTWEGYKYSKRKPKTVYSVRIYEIDEGDLIELRDGTYEVVEVKQSYIALRNLESGEVINMSFNELWRHSPSFPEEESSRA